MTAAILLQPLCFREFDNNGNPLAFGTVTSYQAGTTTPTPTYTDSTAGTPNANPLTLNARGEAQIWCLPNVSYKFVVQDATGNLIRTVDNVQQSQIISLYGGVDTGSLSAYVISFTASFSTLADGILIYFIATHTNTGPSSLNVNGLGIISIVHEDGTALIANDILSGSPVGVLYYNGAWILLNAAYVANLYAKGDFKSWGTTAGAYVDVSADYGSFVPIWNACFSDPQPTGALNWTRIGNFVMLYTAGSTALTALSSSTTLGFTNLPTEIQPVNTSAVRCSGLVDNGVHGLCGSFETTGGAVAGIALSLVSGSYVKDNLSGFTNSGTKGLNGFSCVYPIK